MALAAVTASAQQAPAPAPAMRGDGPAPAGEAVQHHAVGSGAGRDCLPQRQGQELARGFGLNEGPVWVREGNSGYLLVGGLLDNVIYKIAADNTVSVFMEKAGYTGTDVNHTGTQTRSGRSHVLLIGPSCASLDSQGRVIWCADNDRTVMRLEKDGTRTVLSGGLNGKRFSGPNDIYVTSRDAVYLTDNDFGLRDGGQNPDKQMPNGIWLIKDGQSRMVLEATVLGGIPNGVALSPDEQLPLRQRRPADDALRGAARWRAGSGQSLHPGSRHRRRHEGGHARQRLLDQRRRTRDRAHHQPGRTLLGYLNLPIVGGEPKRQICATNVAFGDADAQEPLRHRLRRRVSHPPGGAGVMAGPPAASLAVAVGRRVRLIQLLEPGDLLGRELQRHRRHGVVHLPILGGAEHGRRDGGLAQQPRHRHLGGRHAARLGHLHGAGDHGLVDVAGAAEERARQTHRSSRARSSARAATAASAGRAPAATTA